MTPDLARCPVCRAALGARETCRRCRTALGAVKAVAAHGRRLEAAALVHLAAGETEAAQRLIRRARLNRRTRFGAWLAVRALAPPQPPPLPPTDPGSTDRPSRSAEFAS